MTSVVNYVNNISVLLNDWCTQGSVVIRAVTDNLVHGSLAVLVWLLGYLSYWKCSPSIDHVISLSGAHATNSHSLATHSVIILQSVACGVFSCVVDLDHFMAARSFDLEVSQWSLKGWFLIFDVNKRPSIIYVASKYHDNWYTICSHFVNVCVAGRLLCVRTITWSVIWGLLKVIQTQGKTAGIFRKTFASLLRLIKSQFYVYIALVQFYWSWIIIGRQGYLTTYLHIQ